MGRTATFTVQEQMFCSEVDKLFTAKENIFKNNNVFSNAVWNLQCCPVVLVSEQKQCTAVLTEKKKPFKCLHT